MMFKKTIDEIEQDFKENVHKNDELNKIGILVFQHYKGKIISHFIDRFSEHHLETYDNEEEMDEKTNKEHRGYLTPITKIEKNFLKQHSIFSELVSKLYT